MVGRKAVSVLAAKLPVGRYSKVELYLTGVVGTVNNRKLAVNPPSGKSQIVTSFVIIVNESVSFVLNIGVVEKRSIRYSFLSVIAMGGVIGEDTRIDEVDDEGNEQDEPPINTNTSDKEQQPVSRSSRCCVVELISGQWTQLARQRVVSRSGRRGAADSLSDSNSSLWQDSLCCS
jgi:hypothetical protein